MGDLIYKITVRQEIDCSHQLELPYASGCNNLHGHRWKVEVDIETEALNDQGMVVDFAHVKKVIKKLDHDHMNNWVTPSTAECIAQHLWYDLEDLLVDETRFGNPKAKVVSLRVWETPSGLVELRRS